MPSISGRTQGTLPEPAPLAWPLVDFHPDPDTGAAISLSLGTRDESPSLWLQSHVGALGEVVTRPRSHQRSVTDRSRDHFALLPLGSVLLTRLAGPPARAPPPLAVPQASACEAFGISFCPDRLYGTCRWSSRRVFVLSVPPAPHPGVTHLHVWVAGELQTFIRGFLRVWVFAHFSSLVTLPPSLRRAGRAHCLGEENK